MKYKTFYKEKIKFNIDSISYKLERCINKKIDDDNFYDSNLIDEQDNKIPDGGYFKLIGFKTSELLPSNEIDQIKLGLKKLIKKQRCNKFVINDTDLDNIENIKIYESGHLNYRKIARINFDNNKKIAPYIKYINLSLMNLNESFLILILDVEFTDEEIEWLDSFTKNNYDKSFIKYRHYFSAKSNCKTGGNHAITPSSRNAGYNKLKIREEEFIKIKKLIFDELNKYLPLQLHLMDIIQPSCTLYKTNLDEIQKGSLEFMESIGCDFINKEFFEKYENNLYIRNNMFMYPIDVVNGSNNYVIVFDKKKKLKSTCKAKEEQIKSEFKIYYRIICRKFLAQYLNSDFRDECVLYRNKFANISIGRHKLKKLYNLRTKFYADINFFRNAINTEKMPNYEMKIANEVLLTKRGEFFSSGEFFSNLTFDRLEKFSKLIDKEIEDKIFLCHDLSEIFNIKFNKFINITSLLLAFISLLISLKLKK